MDHHAELADNIGATATRHRLTVGVLESLTGGLIASRLAEASGASRWFRGAVVAYSKDVKHGLLNVPPGPVVSAEAARAMAENGARLLGADVALAVTGVGGPERQDDQSPGTVFLSLYHAGHSHPLSLQIAAHSPSEICHRTCTSALHLLDNHLTGDATTLPSGRTLQAPRSSERRH